MNRLDVIKNVLIAMRDELGQIGNVHVREITQQEKISRAIIQLYELIIPKNSKYTVTQVQNILNQTFVGPFYFAGFYFPSFLDKNGELKAVPFVFWLINFYNFSNNKSSPLLDFSSTILNRLLYKNLISGDFCKNSEMTPYHALIMNPTLRTGGDYDEKRGQLSHLLRRLQGICPSVEGVKNWYVPSVVTQTGKTPLSSSKKGLAAALPEVFPVNLIGSMRTSLSQNQLRNLREKFQA